MDIHSDIKWVCKPFADLSLKQLYEILRLRNEVFVVEQDCPYQDCDGKDFSARHVMGFLDNKLVAYTRVLPVGISYSDGASIGRVVTAADIRRLGVGRLLMQQSIKLVWKFFGETDIIISAQTYLIPFYESIGFKKEGTVYQEDEIDHIKMRKAFSGPDHNNTCK
ncbi:MAG: GNAT family N-acetyltransferase [Chitinophagaceae bacterium]|nr:GNAT family N-acetyltransferase [Chitinophagaceae bacterium]